MGRLSKVGLYCPLKTHKYQEFSCCSYANVVHMSMPAQVAARGNPKKSGLKDDLEWLGTREAELREEIILFGS